MTLIQHPNEPRSNEIRKVVDRVEPRSLRTRTRSLAVLARSEGIYHWTPEGRRLFDYTSGVLVANLGHNPKDWMKRFQQYMGWQPISPSNDEYVSAVPVTAYNAVTPIEIEATDRLVRLLQSRPGGGRLEQVLWAASGSEAIQKAIWAAMARDRNRPIVLATRYGFHGKKGWAAAVTGSEADPERDPRVRFIGFPMHECRDVTLREAAFDPAPYRRELSQLWNQYGPKIGTLITEPYLGGGGSYHPPIGYLQCLEQFCRENDIVFILDEVQSNFGRTGNLFAFETYHIEPDIVVLGKGLGNGVPVAAAVGRRDIFDSLNYGEASDTWSANPLSSAAVLATLDCFASDPTILQRTREASEVIENGLLRLKQIPIVAYVRGEKGGMVWGIEMQDHAGLSASEWAHRVVEICYRGHEQVGIHLLGPLANKVVRIAPPLTISPTEAHQSVDLMLDLISNLVTKKELALT